MVLRGTLLCPTFELVLVNLPDCVRRFRNSVCLRYYVRRVSAIEALYVDGALLSAALVKHQAGVKVGGPVLGLPSSRILQTSGTNNLV